MSEIPKQYEPKAVEQKWYSRWIDEKAFAGVSAEEGQGYSIVIPPPNVTGVLTMGHVLNNTIQDILVRRARLQGKHSMWLPGTDHASIATHARVENRLREQGASRRELGRDKFVEKAWEWSNEHGGIILKQLRALGASCDWDRTQFTMDPEYERAVLHAFVLLYKRGYIYRGRRMVNWCPATQSALSDEEVIMKPQRGKLYTMRYELVEPATGKDGVHRTHLEIATTRPETLMGDTAVAVHPDDERYQHLIGKEVWRPFPRAKLPIVADSAIDLEFGTGVLKVTPAHDRVDFDIGQRHNLPVIDVLNPDGTVNAHGGEKFEGMDRFEARKKAAKKLDEMGLLVSEKDYENNVGFSERKDVPIEPRLSMQWWMRYPKIEEAKAAVRDGHIRFWPQRWEKTYLHWLENIQDWCISRQLWWGQRIPVWYRKGVDKETADISDPEQVHCSLEGPSDPENWEQDDDVLDTWASSWLWPFATMGWPDPDAQQERDLKFFYPTTDLVTGPDIIFFWVARMIMAGLEFMGDEKDSLSKDEIEARKPFSNVYFTGIIRDEKGRKMSKSLGNSPDPLDLIEEFGADGLRFGVMSIAPKGQDILFSRERVSIGRNFCNKLWNACRFRQMSGEISDNSSLTAILERIDANQLDDYDHWILHRVTEVTRKIDAAFASYEFSQLTQLIYELFWSDFCDWYVEASKSKLQAPETRDTCLAVQDFVIRQVLLLLEPFCPFIAEELWHLLGYARENALLQETGILSGEELVQILAGASIEIDQGAAQRVENLKDLIGKARALKASYNLGSKRDVTFFYTTDASSADFLKANVETIKRLIGAGEFSPREKAPEGCPASVTESGTIYLDLASSVDVEAEKARLTKELEKLDKAIGSAEKKLQNEKFTSNAPAYVIQGVRQTLQENQQKKEEMTRLLASLAG